MQRSPGREQSSSEAQIIMQRGATPGAAWDLGADPLIIGRSEGCSIFLDDDTVSRLHCVVLKNGNSITIRDMGSRNRCLVNGVPVAEASLTVGDQFSVGESVFLVSRVSEQLQVVPPKSNVPKTLRVGEVRLQKALESPLPGDPQKKDLPQTAQQYATLFRFSLECNECRDTASLHECLRRTLEQLFDSSCVSILQRSAGGTEWSLRTSDVSPEHIERQATAVLADRQSRIVRRESRHGQHVLIETTMIASLTVSGRNIGAVVLGSKSEKLFDRDDLEFFSAVAHVLAPYLKSIDDNTRLRTENVQLRETSLQSQTLIGKSKQIHALRDMIRQAAHAFDINVLIRGETGTGKELAARMVHDLSDRASRSFVAVNCAAIPNELFESELFGYVKGAFTGANNDKPGLVEGAEGGTLFLDEVGELSASNQARLLRMVETGTYRPLGTNEERHVDVRIISATNRNLSAEEFRSDLFFRLSGFKITVPSLSDYPEDVPLLAEHFRRMFCAADGPGSEGFTPEAITLLSRRQWSGNVRELRQTIHRAVRTTDQALIPVSALLDGEAQEATSNAGHPPVCSLEEVEKAHILGILEFCEGDVRRAAGILGIGQSTLYQKIKKYKT